jgi:hypothetical protein
MASQSLVPVQNGAPVAVANDASMFLPVMQMEQAVLRWNAVNNFVDKMFREGVDYGVIPGTPKPSLLKPGAERICTFFGWAIRFELVNQIENWDGEEPMAYYQFRCSLWRGDYFIGEALGSASTRESKYRYRWVAEADVPPHLVKERLLSKDGTQTYKQFDFAVEKRETTGKHGKPEEYWKAFDEAAENGTLKREEIDVKWGKTGKAIQLSCTVGARLFRIPNPDIFDQFNTALKMAQKRAHVAVALNAGNLSDRFTQDVEDIAELNSTTVGSQEAADAVAQHKIVELQQKQPAPSPGKGGTGTAADGGRGANGKGSTQPATAPAGVVNTAAVVVTDDMVAPSPEIAELWKKMGAKKGTIMEVLLHLFDSVQAATGAEADWYRMLDKAGVNRPEELIDQEKGGGLRKVRKFVADVWLFVRKCQAEPAPAEDLVVEEDPKEDWVPDFDALPGGAQGAKQ